MPYTALVMFSRGVGINIEGRERIGHPKLWRLRFIGAEALKGGQMFRSTFAATVGTKRKLAIVRSATTLVIALLVLYLANRSAGMLPAASASSGTSRTYTTNFPRAENPLSEGGKWANGQKDGLDWTNVRTTPGLALGTEYGGTRPAPQKYDDSTALLTGAWGPDQTAQTTVYAVNPNDKIYEEVELRLRSTLSAHQATGYEILFRNSKSPNAYCEVVRWNGPLGDFTYLSRAKGPPCGLSSGDVVKATIIGNVITAYVNDVQVLRASDDTFKTGNPGIGFYIEGASGVNGDYGFTSFTATSR